MLESIQHCQHGSQNHAGTGKQEDRLNIKKRRKNCSNEKKKTKKKHETVLLSTATSIFNQLIQVCGLASNTWRPWSSLPNKDISEEEKLKKFLVAFFKRNGKNYYKKKDIIYRVEQELVQR